MSESENKNEEIQRQAKSRFLQAKAARFEALSPSEQRMAVAEDVLALLAAGTFRAGTGSWAWIDPTLLQAGKQADTDLQELLHQDDISAPICDVCALGALFCALVRQKNNCPVSEVSNGVTLMDIEKHTAPYFQRSQLRLIGIAFELGNGGFRPDWNNSLDDMAHSFGMACSRNPAIRMAQIFQNILDHDGTFDPRSDPHPEPPEIG